MLLSEHFTQCPPDYLYDAQKDTCIRVPCPPGFIPQPGYFRGDFYVGPKCVRRLDCPHDKTFFSAPIDETRCDVRSRVCFGCVRTVSGPDSQFGVGVECPSCDYLGFILGSAAAGLLFGFLLFSPKAAPVRRTATRAARGGVRLAKSARERVRKRRR